MKVLRCLWNLETELVATCVAGSQKHIKLHESQLQSLTQYKNSVPRVNNAVLCILVCIRGMNNTEWTGQHGAAHSLRSAQTADDSTTRLAHKLLQRLQAGSSLTLELMRLAFVM